MFALRCSVLTLFLLYQTKNGESANILVVSPVPGHSHNVIFSVIVQKLAEKGHNVDFVTHFPGSAKHPRLKEFSVAGSLPIYTNNLPIQFVDDVSIFRDAYIILELFGANLCKTIFNTSAAAQIKDSNKKYDLLITELFGTDCFLGFARFFNVPSILVTTTISLPWGNDRFGNPDNPSYIPSFYSPYSSDMSLYQRFVNTAKLMLFKAYYEYVSMKQSNIVAKEYFGQDLPDLHELANNVSLILANNHFSINYAKPNVINYIEIGGIHIGKVKKLPKHLEDFMASAESGVILVSMGSMLKTESFDKEKLQAMFDAFAGVPQKVLWKANKEDFDGGLNIPDNILFEKWLPQFDVLCHPKNKLFLSHGGGLGGQEAVYCGVPRLGIPYFAEQETNLRAAEHKGIARLIHYEDINIHSFKEVLLSLLNDNRYKDTAQKIARIFKDRPMSAIDTAMYWIEYVLRHRDAKHLRSKGADLPWFKYFLLDVILIFTLLVVTAITLVFVAVRFFVRALFKKEIKMKHKRL